MTVATELLLRLHLEQPPIHPKRLLVLKLPPNLQHLSLKRQLPLPDQLGQLLLLKRPQ